MSQVRVIRGTVLRAEAKVRDPAGVLADPAGHEIRVLRPDGTEGALVPVDDAGAGNFHADIDTAPGPPGLWRLRWVTSDPGAAHETSWMVAASAFP